MSGEPAPSRVIDCDVHCEVPALDALTPFLSDHWRSFLSEAAFNVRQAPLRVAYPAGIATTASDEARAGAGPPGSSLDLLREHVLDRLGVSEAVLTCLSGYESLRHPFLSAALLSAVNDWVAAEWLERDPRLRGGIAVAPHDVDAAVAEIERLGADPRFVQVLLPLRSPELYGKRRYRPLLEAALAFDLPIAIHAWGLSGMPPTASGFPAYYVEDYLTNASIAEAQLTSLLFEGALAHHPKLRVAFLETGVNWVPPLLWRLDKDWKGMRREVPWLSERPSDYVRAQVRFGAEPIHGSDDPTETAELWAMLGDAELVMFSSDYPHDHGGDAPALLAALDAAKREQVLWRTAAAFYGFSTNGATALQSSGKG